MSIESVMSLAQHKRKPEIPVVTRESHRTSRKTTWLPRHRKMRPLVARSEERRVGKEPAATTPSVQTLPRGLKRTHRMCPRTQPEGSYCTITLPGRTGSPPGNSRYVRLFATPWTVAHQASLSFTISWSLIKLMSIESVMPFNHAQEADLQEVRGPAGGAALLGPRTASWPFSSVRPEAGREKAETRHPGGAPTCLPPETRAWLLGCNPAASFLLVSSPCFQTPQELCSIQPWPLLSFLPSQFPNKPSAQPHGL